MDTISYRFTVFFAQPEGGFAVKFAKISGELFRFNCYRRKCYGQNCAKRRRIEAC